jgi:RNA polymerase sigma-70 factor, ECF subfamily
VDPNVIAAARAGDPDAFRSLYESLVAPVTRVVLALVRDRDLADDVVQETFLSVHRGLKDFRSESEVGTWVTRIALNRSRDALRRRRRAPRSLEALELEDGRPLDQRADLAAPEQAASDPWLARVLRAEIARLPEEFRDCFLLREVGEHSYEEIAAIMEIPVGTVRSRLLRARERLRTRLGSSLGGERR